ncbi:MAG: PAS domain-containing protein [Aridibacter sp.]
MPKSNENQSIAVIDTGKTFYSRIKRSFGEKNNLQINWIKSYEKALNSMRSNKHNIYLINYEFKDCSSIRLLKEAKKGGSFSPLIIFNGKREDQIIREAINAGAADFIITETIDDRSLKFTVLHELKEFQFLEHLVKSEAKYRNFIESMPVMFYSAEPNPPYKPIYISKAFKKLGYPLKDWFSDSDMWKKILHPEDCEKFLQIAKQAKENGTNIDVEYRAVTKDGEVRWLRDQGQFVKNENGEILCWQGLIIDITEKKEAEKALVESEKQYRNIFENANDLIYIHDLIK